jgi:hypothetical protein
VLSFASRFEDFADNLAFNVVSNILPLIEATEDARPLPVPL